MAAPLIFPAQHKSRRQELADMLRDIAGFIERDELVCDPHAFVMCLTGPTMHEVCGQGYGNDPEGWAGARQALHTIWRADFRTEGGNIRMRETQMYGLERGDKVENLGEHFRLRTPTRAEAGAGEKEAE